MGNTILLRVLEAVAASASVAEIKEPGGFRSKPPYRADHSPGELSTRDLLRGSSKRGVFGTKTNAAISIASPPCLVAHRRAEK